MSIVLDHTIVRSRDKYRAASFFAALLGLDLGASFGTFAAVRVNDDLTLLFDDRHDFQVGHYAFRVDDPTFDAVLRRLERSTIEFGSNHDATHDRRIYHRDGDRGVYIRDPDGISYELLTAEP